MTKGVANGPPGSRVRYAAGGRAKRVKTGGAQWSEEAEEAFLDGLAASCSVRMAAADIGFSTFTPYRQRRLRPEFAARWDAALRQGYVRLEMALLKAAVDSMEGIEFDADRPIPRMSAEEAMRLLRFHRSTAGDGKGPVYGRHVRPRPFEEVKAGLIRKIDVIIAARTLEEQPAQD